MKLVIKLILSIAVIAGSSSNCYAGELISQYKFILPPVSGKYADAYYTASKASLIQIGFFQQIDSVERYTAKKASDGCSWVAGRQICGTVGYMVHTFASKSVQFNVPTSVHPLNFLGASQSVSITTDGFSTNIRFPFPKFD